MLSVGFEYGSNNIVTLLQHDVNRLKKLKYDLGSIIISNLKIRPTPFVALHQLIVTVVHDFGIILFTPQKKSEFQSTTENA